MNNIKKAFNSEKYEFLFDLWSGRAMAKALDFGSSLLGIESRLRQNNFCLVKNARRLTKSRGRQWETTPVKNFPRKITMERILFIVIAGGLFECGT